MRTKDRPEILENPYADLTFIGERVIMKFKQIFKNILLKKGF